MVGCCPWHHDPIEIVANGSNLEAPAAAPYPDQTARVLRSPSYN
jgi:hypothetical protein